MTDTAPTAAKRSYLSDRQHFEAMKLLEAHLRPVGELWAYVPEWSDQKIADQIGATLFNVSGLRQRAFGALTKVIGQGVDVHRLELLIAAHDQFVRDAAEWINDLRPPNTASHFDPAPYLIGAVKP